MVASEPEERAVGPESAPFAAPIGAADLPLAGLAATAALLVAALGYRELRRHLAASREPAARLLPVRLPASPRSCWRRSPRLAVRTLRSSACVTVVIA
jgi:hypothetical protein